MTSNRFFWRVADRYRAYPGDISDLLQSLVQRRATVAFALMLPIDHEAINREFLRLALRFLHVVHQEADDVLPGRDDACHKARRRRPKDEADAFRRHIPVRPLNFLPSFEYLIIAVNLSFMVLCIHTSLRYIRCLFRNFTT